MKENFHHSLAHVLKWEGGEKYTDHPVDPGGATKYGITRRTLQRWRGRKTSKDDVKALTAGEAADIYQAMYWDVCECGSLPAGFDLAVFDTAVNQGPGRAAKILQRAAKTTADGIIGPVTLKAAKANPAEPLLEEFFARRMWRYGLLKGLFETFGFGWSRRLMNTFRVSLKLIWRS